MIDEDKVLMAMITELNLTASAKTFEWFLDSDAAIHVCNNEDLLSTYVEEQSEIFMGNHASVQVLGKGNVTLKFTLGQKLTHVNVGHAPDVKRNLVVASLLVRRGFMIVIEYGKFVITKNCLFVG